MSDGMEGDGIMNDYERALREELERALSIAKAARRKGFDPAFHPEIKITNDLAERVEAIVGVEGIGDRIRELERDGLSREEIAISIAEDFVSLGVGKGGGNGGKGGTLRKERIVEVSVRTAVAILTEGVVAAPIEGISKISTARNDDGSRFIKIYYAGPIRSAGGTAQALSVLVADIVRRKLGFAEYKPREEEVARYVLEISTYDRISGLQYTPSDEEVRMIVRNCPICIDGEPSEDVEVDSFRDLERVETNKVRGGMALVICEGIALKAAKILRYVEKLKISGWDWLHDLLALKKSHADSGGGYLEDIIAGRPMIGKPSCKGSFRLRYGRARNTGLATVGIHPATMALLEFLAVGTQIKPEMPGKGACIAPVDSIEGPTVKLKDGSLVRLESVEDVSVFRDSISEIVDLGEILVDFGDFLENGRRLEPAAYCHEWWLLELKEKLNELKGKTNEIKEKKNSQGTKIDSQKSQNSPDSSDFPDFPNSLNFNLSNFSNCNSTTQQHHPSNAPAHSRTHENTLAHDEAKQAFCDERAEESEELLLFLRGRQPSMREAIEIARRYDVPLHPAYTYLWEDISADDMRFLASYIRKKGTLSSNSCQNECQNENDAGVKCDAEARHKIEEARDEAKRTLLIPNDKRVKRILEDLLVPHRVVKRKRFNTLFNVEEREFISIEEPDALLETLGIKHDDLRESVPPLKTRSKAPTRIGVRMGRPEKAKERRMKPAPHLLFPLGNFGGRNRSLRDAMRNQVIEVEIGVWRCDKCGNESLAPLCVCGNLISSEPIVRQKSVNIYEMFKRETEKLGIHVSDVKCVMGLISEKKIAEHIVKGILRAKHNVFVFKDGTIRYDMTNMPLTHFKVEEVEGLDVEKARELGYTHDIFGNPLVSPSQIVEIKQQDIIIPLDAASYLMRVANFVDDLLRHLYGIPPYYNVNRKEDLIGKLVIGLAPHTSAGILGRIIGFTRASACFAHPFFHAAKRRNCDGDEDSIMLLMDALLNFSVSFLPEKRGGKMDAPLLLIPCINPKEIDKEAHNVSIVYAYPLQFYEATLTRKEPKEVAIETASSRIHEIRDTYGFGYTHETSSITAGCLKSAYKRLDTMSDKMDAQLRLAEMLRSVDEREVAEIIIKNHLLRDIKGNLRAFGTQRVRCSQCNTKYRRVPLSGRCKKCGGNLLPTVHASNITKYLDISIQIARKYNISETLQQILELLVEDIQTLFPDEEKQRSLEDFL